jgi:uncharacterized protein (DUF2336 family)
VAKSSAYPTLEGLFDLACRDGVDIRPTLLRVLTDLYIQKPSHSAEEEVQYVELAGRLIESVDAATRAVVMSRLVNYSAAPAAILGRLGARNPLPAGAAAPVRQPAQGDLAELFFSANAPERRLILLNLDLGAESARPRLPVAAELIRRLENAALQRNTGEFARTLARALGISQALSERITRDYSGEPVVVAAKSLGMTAAVLQRILLVLNPLIGQSVARVYDLSGLYDEITAAAAERMIAIWRQTGAPAKPSYAPLHYDDERRGARAAATPAEHRGARGRDVLPPAKSNNR